MTAEGASHARARKLLAPFFRTDRLKVDGVLQAYQSSLDMLSEGDVDVQSFFHLATLRAFCRCLLSEDVDAWKRDHNDGRGDVARFVAEACSFGSLVVGNILFDLLMSETLFGADSAKMASARRGATDAVVRPENAPSRCRNVADGTGSTPHGAPWAHADSRRPTARRPWRRALAEKPDDCHGADSAPGRHPPFSDEHVLDQPVT